ncbi:MAG: hypothetical protein J6B06_06485 [Lachnospiraceae bacterium]|nr:hypothetical protein [Lachnospiraceae bacterium]
MKTIVLLAKSRIKYHKSRTLLTAIAIMLTTMLLMGLGTSAVGLLDINRRQAMAQSNIHAALTDLTLEQAQILQNHMDVEAVEINELFAEIEYGKMNGYLTFNESLREGIYHGVGNVTEGHKPEKL